MNKKFTMVCASLLLASAFSVNAANVKPATPENGKAYYVVNESGDNTALSIGDIYLSTSSNIALPTLDETYFDAINKSGQWVVIKNGSKYQLKNVETQKLLAFKDGVLNYDEGKQNTFMIDTEGRLVLDGVASETRYLKIAEGTKAVSLVKADQATKIYFVETVSTSIRASEINAAYGQNISLGFEEKAIGTDVFSKVTAVTVSGNIDNPIQAVDDQFLLMVNGNCGEYQHFDLTNTDSKKAFEAAEFVILSSDKVVENVDYTKGYGFAYKVVKGSTLVKAKAGEKVDGKNSFSNAVFTAKTNTNFDGGLQLAQTGLFQPKSDGKWDNQIAGPIYVGIGGLTSNKVVASAAKAVVVTPGQGTAVNIAKLITNKVIANVYVQNENGVFSEVLVLNSGNNGAEKKKNSLTEKGLPTAQWLVSAVKGENKISLINLANTSVKIENIALYTTSKDGEYKTMSSDLRNAVIKFETVTPSVENGYLNASESELKGTYQFKFVKDVMGAKTELFLQATKEGVGYTSQEDKATDWTLEKVMKTEAGKTEEIDTVFVAPAYNYYNAKGEMVEVKEKKDTISRAFKYMISTKVDNVEKYLSADGTLVNATSLASMGQFAIRQTSGNNYALANISELQDAYVGINNLVAGDNGLENASDYTKATSFKVISEAANTHSYPAASKHVTFEVNGKYIAVNGQDNGILASESSVLKAANDSIIAANFTFYIDSIDAEEAVAPSFYIAHAGKMMVNAAYVKEQAEIAYENDEISLKEKEEIIKNSEIAINNANGAWNRVKFVAATRAEGDTLVINNNKYEDENNFFKFQILENEDGEYILKGGYGNAYVGTVADQLVMTTKELAMPVVVSDASAPTSNEGVSTSEVKVVANNGSVVVKNAAGKNVVVSTILGQVVANEVLTSDNATINVPAGIVVVSVDGESFKVNVR